MSGQPVRITVPRPPQPYYDPSMCAALKDPDNRKVRCGDSARMYTCGPRCDPHSPGAIRTSRETSPTRMEHAA